MKTNGIAELKQYILTLSDPANQIPGTKQGNLNLLVVMPSQLWCLFMNCQAHTVGTFMLENIALLYFRFNGSRG